MTESIPFFHVADMTASVRFYGHLGFVVARRWDVDGELRWCRLECGAAALMLQRFHTRPASPVGVGVSVCFQCDDALAIHDAALAAGLAPVQEPFVGNELWVVQYRDPDGYEVSVNSPTDVAEDTTLSMARSTT